MIDRETCNRIRREWKAVRRTLNERRRRLWAAAKAKKSGPHGIAIVSAATGLARDTIRKGLRELRSPQDKRMRGRVRAPGGGRKPLIEGDPELMAALDALIEPRRGASRASLRWTIMGTRTLADELRRSKHRVGERTVAALLQNAGYDLRAKGGKPGRASLSDGDSQFAKLNNKIKNSHHERQPVIAVGTGVRIAIKTSKETRTDSSRGSAGDQIPYSVDPALSKLVPNASDALDHRNWKSVGIDRVTAAFATSSIRWWWLKEGKARFPDAKRLLIIADGGSQRHLEWKRVLQEFADDCALFLEVHFLPRVTSKCSQIEQHFVSFTTKTRGGKPTLDRQTTVRLIGKATGSGNLDVSAVLDTAAYLPAEEATLEQPTELKITPGEAKGTWIIVPKTGRQL